MSISEDKRDCGGVDHSFHRRLFLQGACAAGVGIPGFSSLFDSRRAVAEVKKKSKKCLLLWLCGAPSQFETWDPKPGKPTGGPFRAIQTNLPGIQISELMPKMAQKMDRVSVIRSMKTKPSEHFQGIDCLTRGEEPRPPFTRPILGSVIVEQLGNLESPVPQFVFLDPCPEGNEFKSFKAGDWSGWLGAQYSPVRAGGEFKIQNTQIPSGLNEVDHAEREALRQLLSRKFENERKVSPVGSYNAAFERVKGLMSCAPLFDLEKVPIADRERYGHGTFAQHTLLARHLLENGATFAMVANGMPWDCHVLNHEIHQMLVPELDHVLATLLDDLEERGMLDDTLVIAMGEFGRTPYLNEARGRDHYPNAWSMMMAGAGIKKGVVFGSTDEYGIDVAENPIDNRRLFATIFAALGIDPHFEYDLPGLPVFHRVEEDAAVVKEVCHVA